MRRKKITKSFSIKVGMLTKSEYIVENDTTLKEEKIKIDNHCEEENVKEKDYYEVSQSKLQVLSPPPGKRMYEF